jgi:hypothetical protein
MDPRSRRPTPYRAPSFTEAKGRAVRVSFAAIDIINITYAVSVRTTSKDKRQRSRPTLRIARMIED